LALLDYRHYKDTINPLFTSNPNKPLSQAAAKVAVTFVADVQSIVKLWKTEDPSSCIIVLARKKDLAAMEYGIRYMYKKPNSVFEKFDKLDVRRLFIKWKKGEKNATISTTTSSSSKLDKTYTSCALFILPSRNNFPMTHAILQKLQLLDTTMDCFQQKSKLKKVNSTVINPKQFGTEIWQKLLPFIAGKPVLVYNHNDMTAAEIFIGNLIPTYLVHLKGLQDPLPSLFKQCMENASGLYTSVVNPIVTPDQLNTPVEMTTLSIKRLFKSWMKKTNSKEKKATKEESGDGQNKKKKKKHFKESNSNVEGKKRKSSSEKQTSTDETIITETTTSNNNSTQQTSTVTMKKKKREREETETIQQKRSQTVISDLK
jgi:hypothetical protein